MLGLIIAINQD